MTDQEDTAAADAYFGARGATVTRGGQRPRQQLPECLTEKTSRGLQDRAGPRFFLYTYSPAEKMNYTCLMPPLSNTALSNTALSNTALSNTVRCMVSLRRAMPALLQLGMMQSQKLRYRIRTIGYRDCNAHLRWRTKHEHSGRTRSRKLLVFTCGSVKGCGCSDDQNHGSMCDCNHAYVHAE